MKMSKKTDKKRAIIVIMAITPIKFIRNGKKCGDSENSACCMLGTKIFKIGGEIGKIS